MATGNTQKAVNFAPATADDKRIDLSFEGSTTSIKISSWVDGLGWCGEKTLTVEPEMLDVLHKLIGAARIKLRHQREIEGGTGADSKVLDFPISK